KMEYSIGSRRWLSRKEIESDEYVDDRCFAAGLHAPGRYDKILNLKECHLQEPLSFKILDFVRCWCKEHDIEPYDNKNHTGFMLNVVIRSSEYTDDLMVNLVTNGEGSDIINLLSDSLLEDLPQITTIVNNINDRRNPTAVGRYENIIYGPGYIIDHIGPYRFKIGANAFFQTNTKQAEKLYEVARYYAGIETGDTV